MRDLGNLHTRSLLAKRIFLFLGLALILGCSGSTSLIVQNFTGKPISGAIKIQTTYAKEHTVRTSDFSIAEGEEVESVSWFKEGPDWLDVEYSLPNEKPIHKRFLPKDYPPGMVVGTSAGAWYFLEVRGSGLTLRPPNKWDIVKRNPQYYIFPALGFLCCGGVIVGSILVALKKARRR